MNEAEAISKYSIAVDQYKNREAINALNTLREAEELLGTTNREIIYLKIKTLLLYNYDARTVCWLKSLFEKYFSLPNEQNTSDEMYNDILAARQYFNDNLNYSNKGRYKQLFQLPVFCERLEKNPSGIMDSLSGLSSFLPIISDSIPIQALQAIEADDDSSDITFTKWKLNFPVKFWALDYKDERLSLIKFKTPDYPGYFYWFMLYNSHDFWNWDIVKDSVDYSKKPIPLFKKIYHSSFSISKKQSKKLIFKGANKRSYRSFCQETAMLLPNTSYIIYFNSKTNKKWDELFLSLCYSRKNNKKAYDYFFERKGNLKYDNLLHTDF